MSTGFFFFFSSTEVDLKVFLSLQARHNKCNSWQLGSTLLHSNWHPHKMWPAGISGKPFKLHNRFAFCYLENILKDQLFKNGNWQFYKWLYRAKKLSGLSRNGFQCTKSMNNQYAMTLNTLSVPRFSNVSKLIIVHIRVSQFPLYLKNGEDLSPQTSRSFCSLLPWKYVKRFPKQAFDRTFAQTAFRDF